MHILDNTDAAAAGGGYYYYYYQLLTHTHIEAARTEHAWITNYTQEL